MRYLKALVMEGFNEAFEGHLDEYSKGHQLRR